MKLRALERERRKGNKTVRLRGSKRNEREMHGRHRRGKGDKMAVRGGEEISKETALERRRCGWRRECSGSNKKRSRKTARQNRGQCWQ